MNETDFSPRPNATDPDTDELADIAERAEPGDEAADLAIQEAGGPGASPDEAPQEAVDEVEREAAPVPASDVTDVPTEEATLDESEAEQVPPEDVVEGEDESPMFGSGPDDYVAPASDAEAGAEVAEPEVAEAPAESTGAEPEPEAALPEADAAEPLAEAAEEAVPAAEAPAAVAEAVPLAVAEPAGEAPSEAPVVPVASPFDPPGDWYVVHTYAGYENKVKTNLHSRIGSMQMEDKIFDVVIPMEDVMEIKGGKRQVVQKKVFPGYLLVKMIYDNDSWYVVRNTPGVTGFVSSGTGTKPTPLSRREVEKILAVKEETQAKPTFRLEWEEGDVVRIVTGPFADFTGTIAEINVEQSKLKVLVNIFDRETPVELAFDQVAKS
jgi:transcription termination/antitermination protein NusG